MDNNLIPIVLEQASTKDVEVLLTWFNNLHQMTYWGGPGMSFPVNTEQFIEQIQFQKKPSYALTDGRGELLAFGQFYRRLDRNHLGRLVVSPGKRGLGLGKLLVQELIVKATELQGHADTSLFVMRDNMPALSLYSSLGFIEHTYPEPLHSLLANCAYMILEQNSLQEHNSDLSAP